MEKETKYDNQEQKGEKDEDMSKNRENKIEERKIKDDSKRRVETKTIKE